MVYDSEEDESEEEESEEEGEEDEDEQDIATRLATQALEDEEDDYDEEDDEPVWVTDSLAALEKVTDMIGALQEKLEGYEEADNKARYHRFILAHAYRTAGLTIDILKSLVEKLEIVQ